MLYKGQDLDLRTLHGSLSMQPTFDEFLRQDRATGRNSIAASDAGSVAGNATIWVDDLTLRLLNQAFDLAVAHGSEEVGLEHLLHSMTQIGSITAVLYELNIHVSGLRRETATLIAERAPLLRNEKQHSPPRSRDLEEVLNQAVARAYSRRSPVITADILDTLFDMSRDHPTRQLLHRHRPEFELRDVMDTMPPVNGINDGRRKIRVSAGRNYINEFQHAPSGVQTVTDAMQDSRMDDIEEMLRVLSEEMSRNRSTFSQIVGELRGEGIEGFDPRPSQPIFNNGQRGYRNGGDDAELQYMLSRMEQSISSKFGELMRGWSILGERLSAVERSLDEIDGSAGRPFELTPEVEARLKTISFADDRLVKLESMLAGLPQRLAAMEARIEQILDGEGGYDSERMFDKLEAVEKLMLESPSGGSFELAPVMSSLRDLEAGLRGVGGQIREVDSRSGDINLLIDGMSDQQKRLEELVESQQEQIAELVNLVRHELGNIGTRDGGGANVSGEVNAVISERFSGLSSQLQHRMGQLEDLFKEGMERPVVVNATGEPVDNSYLNDAVGKIINNQHTLAGSIDDWRGQVRDDISAIKARIEGMEMSPVPVSTLPDDRFTEISDRLEQLQRTIPTRREPADLWTRFKMWLFGTDDWYRESWGGDRIEDRGWAPPQRDTARPDASGNYETKQGGYDNQRA